jgi:glyoxylase-like metal-dependent hydrolase (beta-lactamase superfamily II)
MASQSDHSGTQSADTGVRFALPPGMHIVERGWLSSNNIVFLGQHDTAMVDTGYLTHAPQTLQLVQHVLAGRRLDHIVNTHIHSDHCGGNALLQQEYGCRISIAAAEADKVAQWDEARLSYRQVGQQCAPFQFTDTLEPGDELQLGDMAWQVLGAPGHDPHSLMLYCPAQQILISADALWENGFGVVFPELDAESGFAEAAATLDLIHSLPLRLVIPGHGAAFTDAAAALARARTRLAWMREQPLRHAQYAVKALLKFLLIERQKMALDQIPALMAAVPLLQRANRRFWQIPASELAEWTVAQLVKSGAARLNGGDLVNAD